MSGLGFSSSITTWQQKQQHRAPKAEERKKEKEKERTDFPTPLSQLRAFD